MHEGFTNRGLRADYTRHARCVPASHAAHRRRAGVAHTHTTKQDCSSGCAHAPSGKRVGGGQAECMWHVVSVQAVHRHRIGPSQARCLDERENLGGKYGWIIVIDVHGRKKVHSLLACK